MVKSQLPRVGKKRISDPTVLQRLGQIFEDKRERVVAVIACKGTERVIPPPHGLVAEEAPFRRAIIEKRENHEVLIEETWEDWTHLSNRPLSRPLRASHVNLTVFAANPSEGSTEPTCMPAEPPVPADESPDGTSVP